MESVGFEPGGRVLVIRHRRRARHLASLAALAGCALALALRWTAGFP